MPCRTVGPRSSRARSTTSLDWCPPDPRVGVGASRCVHDGLVFGPRELPTPEDREWIRGAIAVPIQEVTEVALEMLAWRLTRALESAPDRLMARFRTSH